MATDMLPLSTIIALFLTLSANIAFAGSVLFNSNAIKNIPGVASSPHTVSVSPEELTLDSGTQNLAIDTLQVSRARVCMGASKQLFQGTAQTIPVINTNSKGELCFCLKRTFLPCP